MTERPGSATVHLLAGLNGAGKSTHARRLERELPAVRFSLDEWMLRLYRLPYDDPEYPDRAKGCQELIWDTALQVLGAGVDVILDWNQWSRQRRAYWRDQADHAGYPVVLHYLPVSVATAITRADERRRGGSRHTHVLDEADIRHMEKLFEVPARDEGIDVKIVDDQTT